MTCVMCSIGGFLADHERPASIATDMLQKTAHRGPDAHGLYVDGEIGSSRERGDLKEITKERGSEPTFGEFEIAVYDQFLERFKEERD